MQPVLGIHTDADTFGRSFGREPHGRARRWFHAGRVVLDHAAKKEVANAEMKEVQQNPEKRS